MTDDLDDRIDRALRTIAREMPVRSDLADVRRRAADAEVPPIASPVRDGGVLIRRIVAIAAAVLLVVTVSAVAVFGRNRGQVAPGPAGPPVGPVTEPATTTPPPDTAVRATTSTDDTDTVGTTATAVAPAADHLSTTLRVGSTGADVRMVQQRLQDLGFDPGPVDGIFEDTTRQAVWAFESLVLGVPRGQLTGAVTDEVWQRLQGDVDVQPRRSTGAGTTHVEVYVPEQVLAVFTDDRPVLVAHVSTGEQHADGTPVNWCETAVYDTGPTGQPLDQPVHKSVCAQSKTPGGVFAVSRIDPGNHVSPNGEMFNPVYFNYGIAIHGAVNVPPLPASHGNVRIDMRLAAVLPELLRVGDHVFVWGQDGKQPEDYTKVESLPSFEYADPSSTTG